MSFLNGPSSINNHHQDLGLSQFQQTLQQSTWATDAPSKRSSLFVVFAIPATNQMIDCRSTERSQKEQSECKIRIMDHVSMALSQMAANRLLNFHPHNHEERVDKVEFGLNPWQVLYRLRYPKYIEWAKKIVKQSPVKTQQVLVEVMAAGYLDRAALDKGLQSQVDLLKSRGYLRVLEYDDLREVAPSRKCFFWWIFICLFNISPSRTQERPIRERRPERLRSPVHFARCGRSAL